jgi:hypothetical protein
MGNVQYINGQWYEIAPGFNNAMTKGIGAVTPNAGINLRNYQGLEKAGYLKPIGNMPTGDTQAAATTMQPFTPNAFTQQQLSGLGAAPEWMMDAYTNKIGKMGGNANSAVPFSVTTSGFPGMGGKTAPGGQ